MKSHVPRNHQIQPLLLSCQLIVTRNRNKRFLNQCPLGPETSDVPNYDATLKFVSTLRVQPGERTFRLRLQCVTMPTSTMTSTTAVHFSMPFRCQDEKQIIKNITYRSNTGCSWEISRSLCPVLVQEFHLCCLFGFAGQLTRCET